MCTKQLSQFSAVQSRGILAIARTFCFSTISFGVSDRHMGSKRNINIIIVIEHCSLNKRKRNVQDLEANLLPKQDPTPPDTTESIVLQVAVKVHLTASDSSSIV